MTETISKVVFTMEPFTCPSCIKKIEQTLGRVAGVAEVKVMFNSGRVRVEFDAARTDADALQDTLVKLGYPVLSKRVSGGAAEAPVAGRHPNPEGPVPAGGSVT